MRRMSAYSASAFTLVEILVVIVIIGVLAGITGPRLSQGLNRAKARDARTNLIMIHAANSIYRARNNNCFFPQTVNASGGCNNAAASANLAAINNMNGTGSLNLVSNGTTVSYSCANDGTSCSVTAGGCTLVLALGTPPTDPATRTTGSTNPACNCGSNCP